MAKKPSEISNRGGRTARQGDHNLSNRRDGRTGLISLDLTSKSGMQDGFRIIFDKFNFSYQKKKTDLYI